VTPSRHAVNRPEICPGDYRPDQSGVTTLTAPANETNVLTNYESNLQAIIMVKNLDNTLKIYRSFLLKNKILIEQPHETPANELMLSVGSMTLGFTALPDTELSAFRLDFDDTIDLHTACETSYAETTLNSSVSAFSNFVNQYSDWALSGCDTLQILISKREAACKINFLNLKSILTHRKDQELRAYIATHRAEASITFHIEYSGGEKIISKNFDFNKNNKGGQIREGYQEIVVPILEMQGEATISMTINYISYIEDGTGIEPFLFVADPRIVSSKKTEKILNAVPLSLENMEKGQDSQWLTAALPAYLKPDDQIYLKRGAQKKCIYTVPKLSINLRENYGHTMIFESESDGVGVLCIDGEPAMRLSLGHNMVVRIPTKFLDGSQRHIAIKDESASQIVFEMICSLPYILTPADVLQRESNKPYPISIFPQTAHRYDSLRKQMANANPKVDIKQLSYALSVLEGGYEKVKLEPIVFEEIDSPRVSIIIPAHNKVEVTYLALCSLILAWNEASFEVIVVDDASTDKTSEIETFVKGIRVIHNEVAQRFIRACNAGAKLARGEYLVLLNNDVEVTSGWLDELLAAFDRFENVGLAGSKLLYPDGSLQDAGGIIWGTGNPWNYGNKQNPWDPRFCYARRADYLSGAAMMVPRHLWEQVGGLSQYLEPMYFEDTDFAFKVRDAGYTTWFIPSSIVYHYEGMTSGTDVSSGFKRFQEINRPKFKRKWAKAYAGFGSEGQRPDLEKDRGIIGRVLFIDYTTPRPDHDAGSHAALQEMRLVQSLGYKVTFIATNLAHFGKYTEDLQKLGVEVVYAPFVLSVSEYLVQHATDFDAFYITRYYVAQDTLNLIRENVPKAKVLFNNADLHFLREIRTAKIKQDSGLMENARKIRDAELDIIKKVDVVLSYNDVEHSVIDAYTDGQAKVVKCPWVIDLPDSVPPLVERKGMSFLGSFKHHPNVEGITWFIGEVMPAISGNFPELELTIYGSGMSKEIKELASDTINPLGFIENIADAFDRHRIFIAPLLSGAGIKGKVLSALAHGVPCVLSPAAAEGIGLRHGRDCFIAKTPEDWVDAVTKLALDDDLWSEISQNARSYTQESYSFSVGRDFMRQAFEAADMFQSID
jgi:GT2 family glycosyltransferase